MADESAADDEVQRVAVGLHPVPNRGGILVQTIAQSNESSTRTFVVRDLRLPSFHPEEPVLFLPEGREAISTFADLIIAGVDPPTPHVVPAEHGIYWYLGPVALLIAVGQSSRKLVANVLPPDVSRTTLEVIAAKSTLLRPIHWLAEARAWRILSQPGVRESTTGFYRYSSSKRRRVAELLRALQTIETLQIAPPHLEHRVVSAVGPVIAALDPDFALALLREAERYQWSVRQVARLCQMWEAAAVTHWEQRDARGLPRLTEAEEARLADAEIGLDELPVVRSGEVDLAYPVGSVGLAQLIHGGATTPSALLVGARV